MKKALITGITGQDGSYLAELLLEKGYEVHGTVYKGSLQEKWRISGIENRVILHECDVRERFQVFNILKEVTPDECYHLASRVEPRILFEEEEDIFKINFQSVHHFLQGIKIYAQKCKFFLAGSSLMFGKVKESPQNEETSFKPNTPYGIAKTAGANFVNLYREFYEVFGCTGILYNHESPRRDFHFLPRKITSTAAKIKSGKEQKIILGDIEANRDWGYAGDYVKAMWLMLQQEKPEDYVIGTGESHSVKEILDIAFSFFNLDWRKHIEIDQSFFRKTDTKLLVADIKKIKDNLGWKPETSFRKLIVMMVEEDAKLEGIAQK